MNQSLIKDRILRNYKNYLLDPLNEIDQTLYDIKYYSYISSQWTNDLYEIYQKYFKFKDFEYLVLTSSGSSNFFKSNYKWGPNTKKFIDTVWDMYHRFYKFQNKYWLNYSSDKTVLHSHVRCEGKVLNICFRELDKIEDLLNNSVLITNPINLSRLISNFNFLNILNKSRSVISLTEIDSSFFNFDIVKIPIINQMRSWKEGTGFYTCPFGKFHFTENLFFVDDKKIIDLYNFHSTDSVNVDEIYPIENNFNICECGTYYRSFNFKPQAIRWFYNAKGQISSRIKPLTQNDLENYYEYFQIIQNRNTFKIIVPNKYITDNDYTKVKYFIYDVYQDIGVNIEIDDKIFYPGTSYKAPIFWAEN